MDHNYYRTKKIYSKMYRQCKVPSCKSTTYTTPEKLFLKVPVTVPQREQWLAAAGVTAKASGYAKTPDYFFCEDHFELEKDIENYMAYKMGFLKRIRVKSGSLPSKFSCQEEERLPINSYIKMDVLQGKNIFAIETMPIKSEECKSGLILNVGQNVMYKSTFEKSKDEKIPVKEQCDDDAQGYFKEFYKFLEPKIETENHQGDIVHGYDNLTLVNQIAICKDHDYCKKPV